MYKLMFTRMMQIKSQITILLFTGFALFNTGKFFALFVNIKHILLEIGFVINHLGYSFIITWMVAKNIFLSK